MIAEAAYYLAQKRGFPDKHALDDWLAAEQQMRQLISPILDSEVQMNDTRPNQTKLDLKAPQATKQGKESDIEGSPAKSVPSTPQQDGMSRFEKFAATQAAGDGIQGDTLKKDQTVDEKIGANMADRK
ncbi:MAG: DUF2934 domain-containing protein [Steroidobacteraceae bacterium]